MVTPRGQSYPPERTVSLHFPAYRPPLLAVQPPHVAELNGDDRMAANREQSRRPPNSTVDYCGRAQNPPTTGATPVPPAPACEAHRPPGHADGPRINPQKERNAHSASYPA